jgi:DNA repair protein SbcD/Mre11
LGHIHKAQNLNENVQPPVVYPGSIERVDFGEAADDKFFVIAHLDETPTRVEWRKLSGIRPFHDAFVRLTERENVTAKLTAALPPRKMKDAVVRLTVEYPRDFEPLIDEPALRAHAAEAFEFRLNKKPQIDARARIPGDQPVGSLTPLELFDLYLRATHVDEADAESLKQLATEILSEPEQADY